VCLMQELGLQLNKVRRRRDQRSSKTTWLACLSHSSTRQAPLHPETRAMATLQQWAQWPKQGMECVNIAPIRTPAIALSASPFEATNRTLDLSASSSSHHVGLAVGAASASPKSILLARTQ